MPEQNNEDDNGFFEDLGNGALLRLPVVIVVVAIVGTVAAILNIFGLGDKINVGGLFQKLMDNDRGKDPIDVANSKPENRDAEMGETGEEGFEQRKVERLDNQTGVFRDKSVVEVKGSEGKEKIKLPAGVKDSDVKEVYEIKPGEFQVEIKSTPDTPSDEDIEALKDKL